MLALAVAFVLQFAPEGGAPNRQPQLAAMASRVALVYGAGDRVLFRASTDGGKTFGGAIELPVKGKVALGMRRGPRVAVTRHGYTVTAIVGETLRGQDGDVVAWYSADGKTWSEGRRLNSVERAGREGLHAMAASADGLAVAAWLDLREKGTRVRGAVSEDGGRSWKEDRLIYESPSGSVCECCHPELAVSGKRVYLMFRNAIGGTRDMFLTTSADGGATWPWAKKLGTGTWKLEACPMDGGDLDVDAAGKIQAVWRREMGLYRSGAEGVEEQIGTGKNAVLATAGGRAAFAWMDGKVVRVTLGDERWERAGAWPTMVAAGSGGVLVAWEEAGTIRVERFGL